MIEPLRIRGREVGAAELEQIRGWLGLHPDWSRRRLSEELARAWDWRTPTGQLKDIAARDLLNRLAARGLIRLPARQRRGGRQTLRVLGRSAQGSLDLIGRAPIQQRVLSQRLPLSWCQVQPGQPQRTQVVRYLAEHHYLGYPDGLGQIHYLVRDHQGQDVACLLFGPASWKVAARDEFIGWSGSQRQSRLSHLANNSRFLILPWIQTPHLASHLLAQAGRRLRVDWPARYGLPLYLVETFVETERFSGSCYRAANWIKVGQTQGRTRNDRQHLRHAPPKDVYLLPLSSRFREHLCAPPQVMSTPERLQELERLGEPGQWAVEHILQLTLELVRLQRELELARAHLRKQDEQWEELQRQAHRQAAPFRRPEKERSARPGRPGRKAGHAGCYRPKPEQVEERIRVNLDCCPHCQGPVSQKQSLTQYIEEIPVVRPRVTELTTEAGWCEHCQCEVCSTHPLQVSRASGAAGVQLGPRALALACDLNKAKGLSMRKTVAVLRDHFGLKLTPGGLALLVQRVGRSLEPEYQQMAVQLRQSPVVHADETSWWVGGPGWWLWVFCTPVMTLYVVRQSRAAGVAMGVLEPDFAGVLVSDCLAIYDDLNPLQHKCYSHHLKAVSEACQAHPQGGEGYLLQVRALLRTALWLKALQAGARPDRFAICLRNLRLRAAALLDGPRAQRQEEKVRMRLWKQRDHLFTFLERADVPATNNLAERQLRPAVIARKISCGNKTLKGAQAWQALASIAATCRQTGRSFTQLVAERVPLHRPRAPAAK